jgi:dipeptidyl aminopeptidase/acylaminoacyl peptidase
MRPHDPRYAALASPETAATDATLAYVLALWGVLDPYARYLYARESGRQGLVNTGEGYFRTEEAMQEGNPTLALERGEQLDLPPVLIVQGYPDDNIPQSIPERFYAAYQSAGGSVEIEWFPGSGHGFARTPGPATDRACHVMKAYVARQLAAQFTAV